MGRMIYSRIVIDIETNEVLEAYGREYDGPLALCGGGSGGGSSTTNTVDYSYNWRMATLSEEQQNWAREYFGVWQDYQKPYEIAQSRVNLEMLPYETNLYKAQLEGAGDLLPLETALAKNQLEAANSMLPQENALYRQSLSAVSEMLPKQAEAASRFMNAAGEGVDINERMALASADATNAWKDVRATAQRANARMGVNPNSGRFQGIMSALDTQQAAQLAGARTKARVGAEQENFARLAQAANINATGNMLQAAQAVSPGRNGNASNAILQGINYIKG